MYKIFFEMSNFLSEYSERLISWQLEAKRPDSIDRIWWNRDMESKILTFYGVQIKTRRDDHSITCGVLARERAQSNA